MHGLAPEPPGQRRRLVPAHAPEPDVEVQELLEQAEAVGIGPAHVGQSLPQVSRSSSVRASGRCSDGVAGGPQQGTRRAGDAARSSATSALSCDEHVVVDREAGGLVGAEHLQVLLVQDHPRAVAALQVAEGLRAAGTSWSRRRTGGRPRRHGGRAAHAAVEEREVRGGEAEPALLEDLLREGQVAVVGQEQRAPAQPGERAVVEQVQVAGGDLGAADDEDRAGHPRALSAGVMRAQQAARQRRAAAEPDEEPSGGACAAGRASAERGGPRPRATAPGTPSRTRHVRRRAAPAPARAAARRSRRGTRTRGAPGPAAPPGRCRRGRRPAPPP